MDLSCIKESRYSKNHVRWCHMCHWCHMSNSLHKKSEMKVSASMIWAKNRIEAPLQNTAAHGFFRTSYQLHSEFVPLSAFFLLSHSFLFSFSCLMHSFLCLAFFACSTTFCQFVQIRAFYNKPQLEICASPCLVSSCFLTPHYVPLQKTKKMMECQPSHICHPSKLHKSCTILTLHGVCHSAINAAAFNRRGYKHKEHYIYRYTK